MATGGSPTLFSSVQPLCSEVENPTSRQKVGRCTGKDGVMFTMYCATHWWETILDGNSWCVDIKFICIGVGGSWSSRDPL